jgi:hypothetical protein
MKRIVQRIGTVLAAVLLSSVASAVPASAASGGGCTGYSPISACISYNGSAVWGDFYMNASPGQSWCRAWLEVRTTNVGSQSSQTWYLARGGHYGPLRVVVNTTPVGSGWAITRVHVLDCNGNPTFVAPDSPKVRY